MSEQTWQDMSDNELLHLHALGKLPPEAERAIGKEHLRMVVAWDGANGEPPPLFEHAEEEGPNYNSLTNDAIRAILADRGLDVGGKKAAMVARLQADDDAQAAAGEGDDGEDDDSDEDSDPEPKDEKPKKPKNKDKD